jgi:hypothetical protein
MNLHQHATNTVVGARIVRPILKDGRLEGEAEAFTRKAIDMAMNGGVVTLSGR